MNSSKRYEQLEELVKATCDYAVEERKMYGLNTAPYSVEVSTFSKTHVASGEVYPKDNKIIIYSLPFLNWEFRRKVEYLQDQIKSGVDYRKELMIAKKSSAQLGIINNSFFIIGSLLHKDEDVMYYLQNPDLAVEKLKGSNLNNIKRELRFTDKYLISRVNAIKLYGPQMAELWKDYSKNIIKHLESNGLLTILRHELDHVDFYNSNIQKRFVNKSFSRYDNYLCFAIDRNILMEVRALYLQNWLNKNPDAKKEAKTQWLQGYKDRITYNIAGYLCDKRKLVGSIRNNVLDNINSSSIEIKDRGARKILELELPRYKERMMRRLKQSLDAVEKALDEEPIRLNKANKTSNFNDYISVCNGQTV